MTRFGGTRALTALLVALLVPLGTAERASALDPNQAPDVVLPMDGDTDEDAPYDFTADTAVISVTDPDAGTADVQLQLSVTSGVLHFADTSGLVFVNGTGNDSDTLAMTGSLSAFDAALDKLQFMPAPDDTGTVTLTALVDDLGHNGDGGSLTDLDTMDITVNPVNDAPVVTVPGTQSIDEDTTATFSSATLNPITVSDVDAGTSPVQVTLHATAGTTTLPSTTGLSFSAGDGTGDTTTTFTAAVDAASAALDGLSFTPAAGFSGQADITITTDDLGNTGAGGAMTDTDTFSVTVSPVAVVTPKLSLGATHVAVSPTGRVTVPVSCAGSACAGALSFRSGGTVLGSGAISLTAGGSGSVTVVLTPAGRALVSSRPAVDVTAVVAVTNASTRASVLTLSAPRAPAVTLLTGKARLRGGKVAVTLGCPATAPAACQATLVLTATIGGHVTTIGSRTATIAAGGTSTLKLRLTKAARKALHTGPLAATQTVSSDVAVGLDTVGSRELKLR